MSDGTADGTGKGESGVEVDTGKLARSGGSGLLDNGIDLVRASGRHGGGHFDCVLIWDWKEGRRKNRGGIEWRWTWRRAMRQLLLVLVVVLVVVVIMEEKRLRGEDSYIKNLTRRKWLFPRFHPGHSAA